MEDQDYMRLALELAKRGCGWTNPNPMVGAVLVKHGRIIGQGYHTRYGELHAEREALKACTESPEGATIDVYKRQRRERHCAPAVGADDAVRPIG